MYFSNVGKHAKQLHRDREVVQSDTADVKNSPWYQASLVSKCYRQNNVPQRHLGSNPQNL